MSMYEDFEEMLDNENPMEQYLFYCRQLSAKIDLIIADNSITQDEKIARVDLMRRTNYVTISEYFPEVFNLSLKKSGVEEIIQKYESFSEINKDYFKNCNLSYGLENETIRVSTKGYDFVVSPQVHPAIVLREAGLSSEAREDFHLFVGMLLTPKKYQSIQFAQAVLLTAKKFKRIGWENAA